MSTTVTPASSAIENTQFPAERVPRSDKELQPENSDRKNGFPDLQSLITDVADALKRASAEERDAALPRLQATLYEIVAPTKSASCGTVIDFLLMVGGITLWATFFGLGFWNSASAIFAAFPNPDKSASGELLRIAGSMIAVCVSTVTNTGFLACIAASLGCAYRRMSASTVEAFSGRNDYGRSILAGFFVYLIVLSGLLLLSTKALTQADQEQYVQLAGLLSVVSFVVGYHPQAAGGLFQKVEGLVQQPPRPNILIQHNESDSVRIEGARIVPKKG